MSRTPWPTLAAIGIVASVGIAQAIRVDRRSTASEVAATAGRLGRVEMSAGPWEGRDLAMDRRELRAAEIGGNLARSYVRPDGRALTVSLVCGRPGPISVHTPDACYAGAGFAPEGPIDRVAVDLGDGQGVATFWSATFARPATPLPVRYQILWSWSGDGLWDAKDDPRLAFAPLPVLCKLYVIRELASNEKGGVDDSTGDFLGRFLPQVRRALFVEGAARPAVDPTGSPPSDPRGSL